jgi:hypothetical protein
LVFETGSLCEALDGIELKTRQTNLVENQLDLH